MEGLIPAPRCLQLVGKVESQVVGAAAVPSGWEQMLLYSAGRVAAAVAGQLKEQREVKAELAEEVALMVVWVSVLEGDAEPGSVARVAWLEV